MTRKAKPYELGRGLYHPRFDRLTDAQYNAVRQLADGDIGEVMLGVLEKIKEKRNDPPVPQPTGVPSGGLSIAELREDIAAVWGEDGAHTRLLDWLAQQAELAD